MACRPKAESLSDAPDQSLAVRTVRPTHRVPSTGLNSFREHPEVQGQRVPEKGTWPVPVDLPACQWTLALGFRGLGCPQTSEHASIFPKEGPETWSPNSFAAMTPTRDSDPPMRLTHKRLGSAVRTAGTCRCPALGGRKSRASSCSRRAVNGEGQLQGSGGTVAAVPHPPVCRAADTPPGSVALSLVFQNIHRMR